MINNKILIGRSYDCNLRIDERFNMVSNHHAIISVTQKGLLFEDISTNGSTVNGINVHHRSVIIRLGDILVLASQYQLKWEIIQPYLHTPTVINDVPDFDYANATKFTKPVYTNDSNDENQVNDKAISIGGWNWGAFTFSWLWGVSNRIYWSLIVMIPIVGWVAWPIIAILLGIKGNQWAWEKARNTTDAEKFMRTQKTWNTVGLIFFCISIIFYIAYAILIINGVIHV